MATRPPAPDVATVHGLFMTFEAVPAGSERTRLVLRMRSTVQPEPAPVDSVEVRVEGPEGVLPAVSLGVVEAGRYEASTQQLSPGDWLATVTVRRAGMPDARMTSDWVVASPAAEVDSPLRWWTTSLSAILLIGLASALVWLRRRRDVAARAEPQARLLARSTR